MKLNDYITREGLTNIAFGAIIEVDHSTVSRLRAGQVPSPTVMRRIFDATGGEVTANDFYNLTEGTE